MEVIVEGIETPEDEQALSDLFTKVLFELYIDNLEQNKKNRNKRA